MIFANLWISAGITFCFWCEVNFQKKFLFKDFELRKIFVKRAVIPDGGGGRGTSWSVPPSKTFFPKSGFRPTIKTATPNIQTPAATPGLQSQRNMENYADSWFMSEMWLIRMKRCVTAGLRICVKLHLLKMLVLTQYLTKKGHRPWFKIDSFERRRVKHPMKHASILTFKKIAAMIR